MKAHLPNFFSVEQATDLVRIGKKYDGGYLVSQSDIEKSEILIGLGINDDWSFEEDFLSCKKVCVYAYDASVSKKYFFKKLIKSLIRIDNLKIFVHWITVLVKYNKFFSQPNVHHIQKFVGLNTESSQHCTFMSVLKVTESKNIFFKIDIEGSEYRFLNDIIACEDRITGMVIELHDVDIHLKEIEEFINQFTLNLVHVHANNFSPIREDDDLPLVLELTFSKYSDVSYDFKLPHELDMPNNKNYPDYKLVVNE
tara:strand:+ start:1032 stop:1793 length:762 start_codon:yes stop_codon:yes gene_type:complete